MAPGNVPDVRSRRGSRRPSVDDRQRRHASGHVGPLARRTNYDGQNKRRTQSTVDCQ